jgi:exosome complex component RRP46
MAKPTISLLPLKYPDGSVLYSSPAGDAVLGSVNGPIEVTRRETQKPEEAVLEVIVKPGVGASGVGERYVEGILRGMLSRVILMRDKHLARKGIVVTLVVMGNKLREGRVEERGGSVCFASEKVLCRPV